jgi:hypothetical protein
MLWTVLAPLLSQIGRENYQEAPPPLGPLLRQKEARLDRLSEPDFVGEDRSFGERAAKGKERGIDLIRVEVDLGVCQHRRELLHAVGGAAFRQLMREVFRVVIGDQLPALAPPDSGRRAGAKSPSRAGSLTGLFVGTSCMAIVS